jgi:hypothetical protein
MKIDTSKLTPIQAQQIEAIASGKPFELKLSRNFGDIFNGITVELETDSDPENTAEMIMMAEKLIADTTDNDSSTEYVHKRLATLRKKQAGIPVWTCSNTLKSRKFEAAASAMFRHKDDNGRLTTMVSDALEAKFGPGMRIMEGRSIFGPQIRATFGTWQEARAWTETQQAIRDLHNDAIRDTIDEAVSAFLSTAPTIVKLRARYSGYIDHSRTAAFIRLFIVDLPVTLRNSRRTLKAALTKALDILRPKE